MDVKVILSKQFTLQWRDALKGAILAALTAAAVIIQSSLEHGTFTFNWQQIGMAAVGAFIGYLVKNGILEPSKVITTVAPKVDAEAVKQDIKQAVN